MPTYEYICNACQHEFESFHSIKAPPISVCPKCKKRKVARKLGIGGAVIFKGGGFYETDYRSESYKKGESASRESTEGSATASTPSNAPASTAPAKDAKPDSASSKATPAAAAPMTPVAGATPASAAPPTKPEASAAKLASAREATHPSRIGRGHGNIVQSAAKANSGKKPAPRCKRPK